MKLSEFDYNLPKDLIAQYPSAKRDESHLMVIDRKSESIKHKQFRDIINYFNPGDVLVVNKSKVIPARLLGNRITGGRVEVLLLALPVKGKVSVLTKSNSKLKKNEKIIFENGKLEGRLISVDKKIRKIEFSIKDDIKLMNLIYKIGKIPLPPYIKRETEKLDFNRYQTIYADIKGSIASPTAGLHFTDDLIGKLREKGVVISEIVLHVSYATFNPVKENNISEHNMHKEYFEFPKRTAIQINKAIKNKKKVIAVGTTSTRVLETVAKSIKISNLKCGHENLKAQSGWTNLFIYPPYHFKLTDMLITNFHLPESTLLMLVSAFANRDLIMKSYREAVGKKYRFYSYGDCMIII